MKKQIEIIEKNHKKINELKEKNKKLKDLSVDLWENKEKFLQNEKTIKANNNKIKILEISSAICKNNIYYMLKNDFEIMFKNDLIDLYNNENANKRHINKLIEKIKSYYNEKSLNISCYITKNVIMYHNEINVKIYFLTNEGYRISLPFDYNEEFELNLCKNDYTNDQICFRYRYNISCFIDNIEAEAKRLIKDHEKTIKQIEKLKMQQKELYHEFMDYLHGALYDKLQIENKISIY